MAYSRPAVTVAHVRSLTAGRLAGVVIAAPALQSVAVEVDDHSVDPEMVTVVIGATVQWVREGQHPHPVLAT